VRRAAAAAQRQQFVKARSRITSITVRPARLHGLFLTLGAR
jgi:hypothetical protein